jgi:arsenite methyltransferase
MDRQGSFQCVFDSIIQVHYFGIGSYQIYAIKPKTISSEPESAKFPSPLLNWWDAYPAVESVAVPTISNQDVAELIRHSDRSHYAVVDVRRNDHAVSYTKFPHAFAIC